MRSTRPKWGQHFLTDPNYCRRISDAVEVGPEDLVVEIGPGPGALTRLLAARAGRLVGIEIDPGLAADLRTRFSSQRHVEIVCADILKTSLEDVCGRYGAAQCRVVGNLPYYITSPILHSLFRSAPRLKSLGVLVQLEVAERLTAQPGSRDYGYLTVMARLYAEPGLLFQIPPGAFSPPPKVTSAWVAFSMHGELPFPARAGAEEFLRFVQGCFAQKRKKLINNLIPGYERRRAEQAMTLAGIGLNQRAEQLTLDQFLLLYSRLRTGNSGLSCSSG